MKQCLACHALFNADDWSCPQCGKAPINVNGFISFAPYLQQDEVGFRSEFYEDLVRLEQNHFWFLARSELIVWALKRYASGICNLLEIGCGTGFVLSTIGRHFPEVRVYGSEVLSNGLQFAARRVPSGIFSQMDARRIPFSGEFDCIGAFDVLEHIVEDDEVLREIRKALRKDGLLLITVPQHSWLWSNADEYACHVRRYSGEDLSSKIIKCGFEIVRSTSFVTALLPLLMVSRLMQKDREKFDPISEYKISRATNFICSMMMKAERMGIRMGLNFPIGGSRLVVARKI